MSNNSFARGVLFSTLLTLVIIGGAGYAFKDYIFAYLKHELAVPQVQTDTPRGEQPTVKSTEEKVIEAIAGVNDAVVSVIVTKDVPVYERYYETYDPFGLFGGFQVPRVREQGTEEREVGGGSGFIVSNNGMIVTNRHVVSDPEANYSVLLNDGTSYEVEVLARDPQFDIALLEISEPLERAVMFVSFGDSESLELGQTVIAIGNALAEFRNSVSVGVVSGLSRSITANDRMGRSEQLDQVIQTDAAINPGNSGGPLLNTDGEVVGVNVATSRGADNIGFALPAHVVERVVESVREYGEIISPFLGVRYVMLNPEIAARNDLAVDYGAWVVGGSKPSAYAVEPGSPADLAGIAEGAVIRSIDGEPLDDRDLASVLRGKAVDDTVELEVWQDGETRTVTTTLVQAE